jgi:hypothetical protein
MQAPQVATADDNIDNLKTAVANVISQCHPTPSSSPIDREWRTFLVRMVTRPTDKLVSHAETANTPELAHRIITSAHAFLDSVESALRDDAFAKVMNVRGQGEQAWPAHADRIFKIEQEAERLRTAFDTYGTVPLHHVHNGSTPALTAIYCHVARVNPTCGLLNLRRQGCSPPASYQSSSITRSSLES